MAAGEAPEILPWPPVNSIQRADGSGEQVCGLIGPRCLGPYRGRHTALNAVVPCLSSRYTVVFSVSDAFEALESTETFSLQCSGLCELRARCARRGIELVCQGAWGLHSSLSASPQVAWLLCGCCQLVLVDVGSGGLPGGQCSPPRSGAEMPWFLAATCILPSGMGTLRQLSWPVGSWPSPCLPQCASWLAPQSAMHCPENQQWCLLFHSWECGWKQRNLDFCPGQGGTTRLRG